MRFLPLLLCSVLVVTGCGVFGGESGPGDDASLSMGAAIDDTDLEVRIREDLLAADERFTDARIHVMSYNARVLITGRVPDAELIETATEVVRGFRRVRLLHNELRVGEAPVPNVRASDQWISVRVKGRLVGAGDFPSRQVRLTTDEGRVYLLGLVTREQGQQAESLAAAVNGVQRVVSIFDYTD